MQTTEVDFNALEEQVSGMKKLGFNKLQEILLDIGLHAKRIGKARQIQIYGPNDEAIITTLNYRDGCIRAIRFVKKFKENSDSEIPKQIQKVETKEEQIPLIQTDGVNIGNLKLKIKDFESFLNKKLQDFEKTIPKDFGMHVIVSKPGDLKIGLFLRSL